MPPNWGDLRFDDGVVGVAGLVVGDLLPVDGVRGKTLLSSFTSLLTQPEDDISLEPADEGKSSVDGDLGIEQ